MCEGCVNLQRCEFTDLCKCTEPRDYICSTLDAVPVLCDSISSSIWYAFQPQTTGGSGGHADL